MGFRARLTALLCACLVGVWMGGCGESSDEITLGSATTPTKIEKNRAKIEALERRLADRDLEAQKTASDSPSPPGKTLVPGAMASFDALAASVGGKVGVAMGPAGSNVVEQLGPLQTGAAWSTIKVPIAARVIEDVGGVAALSPGTRDLLRRAITASDNTAAAKLWGQLEATHGGPSGASEAVSDLLAAVGDAQTTISTVGRDGFSPYGQTEWSLMAQEQFASALAARCVAPAAAEELLDLMGQIVPDQRWGLGTVDASARFKGGWGPGTDGRYLVRQFGVVEQQGGALAVAIAAIPTDGLFTTGTAIATQLAQWVVGHTNWVNTQSAAC